MASEQPTLGATVTSYLTRFDSVQRQEIQEALVKLVRWFGRDRRLTDLSPREVEEYAQHLATPGATGVSQRLAYVKDFLAFLRKEGLTAQNLAQHLKATGKAQRTRQRPEGLLTEPVYLTLEGHQQLNAEMDTLRQQQRSIAEEIRRAAADKDVRENAPLEAAREQQGQVMSRLQELERTLRVAVVHEGPLPSAVATQPTVTLGSRVALLDVATGQQTSYLLVNPNEASPLDGKLSSASPVGQALLRRKLGEEVEVITPRGKVRLRVTDIGR